MYVRWLRSNNRLSVRHFAGSVNTKHLHRFQMNHAYSVITLVVKTIAPKQTRSAPNSLLLLIRHPFNQLPINVKQPYTFKPAALYRTGS
ncbi:hypothetical protein [Paenibacillus castaneae]|uniref:hypothetical protein n=1 Tax=Paenibacillus castaneae TaxID=474957 RepID=UPI001ABA2542|nr:hypothetical protein [Paenibacillus castaneae]